MYAQRFLVCARLTACVQAHARTSYREHWYIPFDSIPRVVITRSGQSYEHTVRSFIVKIYIAPLQSYKSDMRPTRAWLKTAV